MLRIPGRDSGASDIVLGCNAGGENHAHFVKPMYVSQLHRHPPMTKAAAGFSWVCRNERKGKGRICTSNTWEIQLVVM